jgi:hypothetical protein
MSLQQFAIQTAVAIGQVEASLLQIKQKGGENWINKAQQWAYIATQQLEYQAIEIDALLSSNSEEAKESKEYKTPKELLYLQRLTSILQAENFENLFVLTEDLIDVELLLMTGKITYAQKMAKVENYHCLSKEMLELLLKDRVETERERETETELLERIFIAIIKCKIGVLVGYKDRLDLLDVIFPYIHNSDFFRLFFSDNLFNKMIYDSSTIKESLEILIKLTELHSPTMNRVLIVFVYYVIINPAMTQSLPYILTCIEHTPQLITHAVHYRNTPALELVVAHNTTHGFRSSLLRDIFDKYKTPEIEKLVADGLITLL